jgi:hypothetical protein
MFAPQPQTIEMTTIYSQPSNKETLFLKQDPADPFLYPQVVEE